jgi:flagellar assembly protein FliH
LSNRKIIKGRLAVNYDMPSLEDFSARERVEEQPVRVDPEAIEREAYQTGYAAGEKAGFEMGQKKAAVLSGQLEKLCEDVAALNGKVLSALEPQVLLLAVTMARKILQEELSLRPEIIQNLIKEGLNRISKTEPITIKLSRPLYELVHGEKEAYTATHRDLLFELDPSLSGSGVVICSSVEEVPIDLDFQLATLVEELRTTAHHD